MARVVTAFSKKESDDKSERTKRKAEELARAGKVGGGGDRPFAFGTVLVRVIVGRAIYGQDFFNSGRVKFEWRA